MKYVLAILAVVALFAGPALAADGNVSNQTLAKMGLANMTVMSDSQGAAVRGLGWGPPPPKTSVTVSGSTYAYLLGSNAVGSYGPTDGVKFSNGAASSSITLTNYINVWGCMVPVSKTVVTACATSWAYAK